MDFESIDSKLDKTLMYLFFRLIDEQGYKPSEIIAHLAIFLEYKANPFNRKDQELAITIAQFANTIEKDFEA